MSSCWQCRAREMFTEQKQMDLCNYREGGREGGREGEGGGRGREGGGREGASERDRERERERERVKMAYVHGVFSFQVGSLSQTIHTVRFGENLCGRAY